MLKIRKSIDAMDFQYKLDLLFTPRQKQILFKKIFREKLSKTEGEYYSRAIKKKIKVLADDDIHRIAQMLLY